MRPILIVLVAVSAAALPAGASSHPHLSAGAVLWSHDTNLDVESATEFDGTDDTADQMARDWDVLGSGAGLRIGYDFPKIVGLYGEVGVTQATVRDRDVEDPSQDVGSLGFNDGAYYALGARLGSDFAGTSNLFWTVEGSYRSVRTDLDEDITTSWDYDESRIAADGRIGVWVQQVGFFGGLRFVDASADLSETDTSNLPGEQTRNIELQRENSADFLLGAQTRGSAVSGFAELGLGGAFSASAGVRYGF
ncbi:MAG TPA: hypothetical protein VFR31_23320 [Thermoanaerobaculia bacterium]|nr:hypothetical protein [Thermoanaerobaculia bacterium]